MNHRWVVRGLVAALHIGLIGALWLHKPVRLDDSRDRRLTTVRLVQPRPRQAPPPTPAPTPAQRTLAPAMPNIAPPTFKTEAETAAAASPAPTAAPPDFTPTEPPRTTLRLMLPPGYAASSAAARNPALADARSNTVRPTFEDRIADAAGATGAWVSERTSDHRTLMRRGDTCMEVLRSRIADTDPFNNSVAPRTVPMYGKPYKCK